MLPDSPADRKINGVFAGEIVLSIDGVAVDPAMDLTSVLNGLPNRDVHLRVRNVKGDDREVVLRPILFRAAQALLYPKWISDTRVAVDALSKGTLGYLHIRQMNWPSFQQFERDLYAAGAGRDGLIIDVRDNGGGSTTDHLLTALTQPRHALTVPRGGGPGYPQDRTVYATWNKPIVVLCNQNSFSNAEIFSHAIKTLKRENWWVQTPGVISTGGRSIMDVSCACSMVSARHRRRHGTQRRAGPILWLRASCPGQGHQVEKAVQVLLDEVEAWKKRPQTTCARRRNGQSKSVPNLVS